MSAAATDAGGTGSASRGEPGLSGRTALVTAASDGLGLACALRLARAGCNVAICARRRDRLDEAERAIAQAGAAGVLAMEADLADPDAAEGLVPATVARFGSVDILIVNSGHIAYGGLEDLSDEQWHEGYALLLMSAVRLARAAVPVMRAAGGGDIVFLTSATLQSATPHLLLSSVFRTGVASLAKTLSHAVAADGIRVNTVAPGYFDTGRVRERIDALVAQEGIARSAAVARVAGDVPVGRIGMAEELANVVAFVVGPAARYLDGATITLDGGKGRALF